MSDEDENTNSKPSSVDLADFIGDHTALFIMLGVFAALPVYISQTTTLGTSVDSGLMATLGYAAALGMTLLILGLVYKELVDDVVDSWHHLYQVHFRLDNPPLALPKLFNVMLALSLRYLVARYEVVVFMIVLVAAAFAAVGVVSTKTKPLFGKSADLTGVDFDIVHMHLVARRPNVDAGIPLGSVESEG